MDFTACSTSRHLIVDLFLSPVVSHCLTHRGDQSWSWGGMEHFCHQIPKISANQHPTKQCPFLWNCETVKFASCTSNFWQQVCDFRKYIRFTPRIEFESSRSPAKSESWNRPQSTMLSRVTHTAILSVFIYVMNVGNQTSEASVTSSCPFCDRSCNFVDRPENVKSSNSCQIQTF